jgi:hypothetical protein
MIGTTLEMAVTNSLNRSVAAFNQGSPEFFDEFAIDATIYMADSAGPIKGREAYRQRYESALCEQGRDKTILDRKIQIVGDKAVVTQKARIKEADATADVFQTLIYGQTDEGVKVLHSQTSLAPPNGADKLNTPAAQVVVERVATSAPVVGVAQ